MNLELINNKIQEMLPEKRYKHSLNVADCAVKLSEIYGCDKEKAYIAGIPNINNQTSSFQVFKQRWSKILCR